jgi:hypothetical protein
MASLAVLVSSTVSSVGGWMRTGKDRPAAGRAGIGGVGVVVLDAECR